MPFMRPRGGGGLSVMDSRLILDKGLAAEGSFFTLASFLMGFVSFWVPGSFLTDVSFFTLGSGLTAEGFLMVGSFFAAVGFLSAVP